MKITQLKYKQVEAEIQQLTNTLPIGAKLPSERNLAITYGCNFLTVRKALKQLVGDGTIVRRIGSGTFISRSQQQSASVHDGLKRVGIMVYQKSNAYAYQVLQAIAHSGLDQKVELRSCWVNDFSAEGIEQANRLQKEGCTALILPWFPHEIIDDVSSFVQNSPLPVTLPMLIPGLEKNCFEQQLSFGSSMITSTEALCRYYYLLGSRQIAFLGPDSSTDVILQKRLSAYSCYISRENLPSLCGLVPAGARAMDLLAERWKVHQGNLAIVSYDDEHALRFITAMHKIGLSAPGDFWIIGFNDAESSRYSDPPLSTICQNFNYIGHWLIKHALSQVEGRVVQSAESPRHQLLVRFTVGGRDKIDDAFRKNLPDMDIILDTGDVAPAAKTPAAQNGVALQPI